MQYIYKMHDSYGELEMLKAVIRIPSAMVAKDAVALETDVYWDAEFQKFNFRHKF